MVRSMALTPLEQVLTSAGQDVTVASVSALVGLSKQAVTQILQVGLPLMAREADDHPVIFKAMFQQSLRPAPARGAAFYESLQADSTAEDAALAAFRAMFGPQTDVFTREASLQAKTTEQQAGQVLAVTMPVLVHCLAELNLQRNEMGFGGSCAGCGRSSVWIIQDCP